MLLLRIHFPGGLIFTIHEDKQIVWRIKMKAYLQFFGLSFLALWSIICAGADGSNIKVAADSTQLFTYDRLYSDKSGNSHFDKVTVSYNLLQYDKDTPAVWMDANGKRVAKSITFMAAPTGWDGSAHHPPPAKQFFIVLSGSVAFTASDGETRILQPGQIILMEDHTGIGHGSFNAGQGVALVAAIALPE